MCDLKRTLDATVRANGCTSRAKFSLLCRDAGTLCARNALGDREDGLVAFLDRLVPAGIAQSPRGISSRLALIPSFPP